MSGPFAQSLRHPGRRSPSVLTRSFAQGCVILMEETKRRVVVVGGGFGGMAFCGHFKKVAAAITIVDRRNHHLFQPLLYQVATCGLAAPDIAEPIRSIFRHRPEITVLLGEVEGFDLGQRKLRLRNGDLDFDYLILATGSETNYFGHPQWEEFAPGLKSLNDALTIRNRLLLAFERAENQKDPAERDRLMTFVIIGGGATGVELSGSFADLTRTVLNRDFRHINPAQSRIILIDSGPRVLAQFSPILSASAQHQLEKLGVQVRCHTAVKDIRSGELELGTGEVIRAGNIFWAAGVSASPLNKELGVELDKDGRVKVKPDLSLPGHSNVFVIGDAAAVLEGDGKPVPGVSPAAMQMGKYVAELIAEDIKSNVPITARPAFKYWDKGTMATIGRSAAVAQIGKVEFSGRTAWLAWLFTHLIFLIGFRNRVSVLSQWIYSYLFYKRSSRIITTPTPKEPLEKS